MIDLGRETDGNNGICLGVHFALCIVCILLFLGHLVRALSVSILFFFFRHLVMMDALLETQQPQTA